MTHIFNGKEIAVQCQKQLIDEAGELIKRGVKPKLVIIFIGDDPASKLFLSLKKTAATEIGVDLEIKEFPMQTKAEDAIILIQGLNSDQSVHGIMIQLPLPETFSKKERDQIINTIADEKDIDGMKEESPYLTPVIKAILTALKEASEFLPVGKKAKVAVVGAKGFVGSRAIKVLGEMDYKTQGVNRKTKDWEEKITEADVVISATGEERIINGDLIKDGAVVIDVGSPKPDVDKESVKGKASFLSPVPGGVGPLTVVLLLENLLEAASQ